MRTIGRRQIIKALSQKGFVVLEQLQQLEALLNCPLSEQEYRALLVTQDDLT
jgi:hypothetical protein